MRKSDGEPLVQATDKPVVDLASLAGPALPRGESIAEYEFSPVGVDL